VTCDACVVVTDTGEVLFKRAARLPRPNASTTKMVTALLVVERVDLAKTVVVSSGAAGTGGGGVDLGAGERYRVGDLLYALLLSSSNDAAVALAEHVAGSEPAFVALMNDYVDRLGLRDTHFVTAHGLDRVGHHASALDLARIGELMLAQPVLKDIVATRDITIGGPGPVEAVENRNPLLETYRGALGIKTGYTANAGNVLIAAARRHGRRVIAVAMGSDDAAADAAALMTYGFAALARQVLLGAGAGVGSLVYDPAGAMLVIAGRAVRGAQRPDQVEIELIVDDQAAPPFDSGEKVGEVVLSVRGRVFARAPAVVAGGLDEGGGSGIGRALAGLLSLAGRVWGR